MDKWVKIKNDNNNNNNNNNNKMWTSPSKTKGTLFVVSRRYLVNEQHCLGRVGGGGKVYFYLSIWVWKPAHLSLP